MMVGCGNSSKSLTGKWTTNNNKDSYPNTLVLNADGTGYFDGNEMSWTENGMAINISVKSGGSTSAMQYFYSLEKGTLSLVSTNEPEWSSDYGVNYHK